MTIDEAIKLLDVAKEGWPLSDGEKYYLALELGLEALRRVRRLRAWGLKAAGGQLRGETEE